MSMKVPSEDIMVDDLDQCRNLLSGGLRWKSTPQGHAYWQDVYDNITALIEANKPESAKRSDG